jgi:hypothetical protein
MGQGLDPRVSFTHRRFAEYLAARNLLRKPDVLPLEDIPTDSLWRDTLVLYCEIAPECQARAVAEYCWSQMQALRKSMVSEDSAAWLRGLHCLRFLAEAFRTHRGAIASFRDELYAHVLMTTKEGDVLSAKWALETAGLFEHEQSTQLIHAALKRHNPWLAETALSAGRYLRELDLGLQSALFGAVKAKPYLELWTQRRDLNVAFRASPALKPVLFFFWTVVLDSWIWGAALGILAVVLVSAVAVGQLSSRSFLFGVVIWVFLALLYGYASGARTRWISLLVPTHPFGLIMFYRMFIVFQMLVVAPRLILSVLPDLSNIESLIRSVFPDLRGTGPRWWDDASLDQLGLWVWWSMTPFAWIPVLFFLSRLQKICSYLS